MPSRAESGNDAAPSGGVSPTFLALLRAEPLGSLRALDIGTGTGRLALILAAECPDVIGIDRDPDAIAEARRRAEARGLEHVAFEGGDAEVVEYGRFAPALIVAHLCMSDAIVERAARALTRGAVLAFVALHVDQWRETGRRSRFAYDEEEMRRLLVRTGFRVEHLAIDREVRRFASVEEGLAGAAGLAERWRADGRWDRYVRFLEEGGRSLTRSYLVVKARRT